MRQQATCGDPMIGFITSLPAPFLDAHRPARDGVLMENMLSVALWYCLAAIVVLTVDGLALRWVEQGQPDPLRNLDRLSEARLRK